MGIGGARVSYAVLLLVSEIAFTLLGVAAGSSPADSIVVVYRWSAPAGIVIMAALLVVGLARSRTGIAVVVGLALARLVGLIVALAVVGSADPSGRSDGSYLLIFFYGTVYALAAVLLTVSVLRRVSSIEEPRR